MSSYQDKSFLTHLEEKKKRKREKPPTTDTAPTSLLPQHLNEPILLTEVLQIQALGFARFPEYKNLFWQFCDEKDKAKLSNYDMNTSLVTENANIQFPDDSGRMSCGCNILDVCHKAVNDHCAMMPSLAADLANIISVGSKTIGRQAEHFYKPLEGIMGSNGVKNSICRKLTAVTGPTMLPHMTRCYTNKVSALVLRNKLLSHKAESWAEDTLEEAMDTMTHIDDELENYLEDSAYGALESGDEEDWGTQLDDYVDLNRQPRSRSRSVHKLYRLTQKIAVCGDVCLLQCYHSWTVCPTTIPRAVLDMKEAHWNIMFLSWLEDKETKYCTKTHPMFQALIEWFYKYIAIIGNDIYDIIANLDVLGLGYVMKHVLPEVEMSRNFLEEQINDILEDRPQDQYRVMREAIREIVLVLGMHDVGAPHIKKKQIAMQIIEVAGCSKMFSYPIVRLEETFNKTHKLGTMYRPVDVQVAMDIGAQFRKTIVLAHLSKHKRWPNIDKDTLSNSTLRCWYEKGSAPPSGTLDSVPLRDWRCVKFTKTFEFNYTLNIFDLVKDKATSYPVNELLNYFDQRTLPPDLDQKSYPKSHTRRLLLEVLKREDLNMYEEVMNFLACGHCKKYRLIGLRCKECEQKILGRLYSITPLIARFLHSVSESNITEHILEMLSAQTLNLSGSDLDKRLLDLSEKIDGSGDFMATDLDFKKWNLLFRRDFETHLDCVLDELYGIGPFFSKLRSEFSSFLLANIDRFSPPIPINNSAPDEDKVWRYWSDHQGGLEGIFQKRWTIFTQALIKYVYQFFDVPNHLTGSGDNQCSVDDFRKVPESNREFILNEIRLKTAAVLESVGMELKTKETWSSKNIICYNKKYHVLRSPVSTSTKRCVNSFGGTDGEFDTMSSLVADVFSSGQTMAACTTTTWSSPVWAMTEAITQLKYNMCIPKSVKSLNYQDMTSLLSIPICLGGLPIILFHSFIYRSKSTRLTEEISWMSYWWAKYSNMRGVIHRFLKLKVRQKPESELLLQLIMNPNSFNLDKPPDGIPEIKRNIISMMRSESWIKNDIVKKAFDALDEANVADIVNLLACVDPLNPKLLHECVEFTPLGVGEAILSKMSLSTSLQRMLKHSRNVDTTAVIGSANIRCGGHMTAHNHMSLINHDNFGTYLSVVLKCSTLKGVTCSRVLVGNLMNFTWNRNIDWDNIPSAQEQVMLHHRPIVPGTDDIGVFVNIPSDRDNILTSRGPFKANFGGATSSKYRKGALNQLQDIPFGSKLINFVKVYKMIGGNESNGLRQFFQILLDAMSQGLSIEELAEWCNQPKINIYHRLHLDLAGGFANTLSLFCSLINISTNNLTTVKKSKNDFSVNFLEVFLLIQACIQFLDLLEGDSSFIARLNMECCTIPLDEVDYIYTPKPGGSIIKSSVFSFDPGMIRSIVKTSYSYGMHEKECDSHLQKDYEIGLAWCISKDIKAVELYGGTSDNQLSGVPRSQVTYYTSDLSSIDLEYCFAYVLRFLVIENFMNCKHSVIALKKKLKDLSSLSLSIIPMGMHTFLFSLIQSGAHIIMNDYICSVAESQSIYGYCKVFIRYLAENFDILWSRSVYVIVRDMPRYIIARVLYMTSKIPISAVLRLDINDKHWPTFLRNISVIDTYDNTRAKWKRSDVYYINSKSEVSHWEPKYSANDVISLIGLGQVPLVEWVPHEELNCVLNKMYVINRQVGRVSDGGEKYVDLISHILRLIVPVREGEKIDFYFLGEGAGAHLHAAGHLPIHGKLYYSSVPQPGITTYDFDRWVPPDPCCVVSRDIANLSTHTTEHYDVTEEYVWKTIRHRIEGNRMFVHCDADLISDQRQTEHEKVTKAIKYGTQIVSDGSVPVVTIKIRTVTDAILDQLESITSCLCDLMKPTSSNMLNNEMYLILYQLTYFNPSPFRSIDIAKQFLTQSSKWKIIMSAHISNNKDLPVYPDCMKWRETSQWKSIISGEFLLEDMWKIVMGAEKPDSIYEFWGMGKRGKTLCHVIGSMASILMGHLMTICAIENTGETVIDHVKKGWSGEGILKELSYSVQRGLMFLGSSTEFHAKVFWKTLSVLQEIAPTDHTLPAFRSWKDITAYKIDLLIALSKIKDIEMTILGLKATLMCPHTRPGPVLDKEMANLLADCVIGLKRMSKTTSIIEIGSSTAQVSFIIASKGVRVLEAICVNPPIRSYPFVHGDIYDIDILGSTMYFGVFRSYDLMRRGLKLMKRISLSTGSMLICLIDRRSVHKLSSCVSVHYSPPIKWKMVSLTNSGVVEQLQREGYLALISSSQDSILDDKIFPCSGIEMQRAI